MSIDNRFWLLLLLCSLILTGCIGDRCLDADDFGFDTMTISSRYSEAELYSQVKGQQVAPWINSGYRVNGRPLTILVRTFVNGQDKNNSANVSAWCPWYGTQANANNLSTFCNRLSDCMFIDDQMCNGEDNAPIMNPPCILRNGVGLYGLIAKGGSYDPNSSFISMRNPSGITFHLGEALKGYNLYDISANGQLRKAGGVVYQYSGKESLDYADSPLYFKILDKFYDDNNGQYRIVIKSGVHATRPDPIESLTILVKQHLFGIKNNASPENNSLKDNGIIPSIYKNLVKKPGYRLAIYGMLCLYIMFTAFSYLVGNINVTNAELITRLFKFFIVSILLDSDKAWSFFNDYLFVFFVDGVSQIIAMLQEAGASGPGSTSLLGLMVAPQTQAKLWSLLFTNWQGFIYIILFLIALYFVIMMTFQATVLYLTSLIFIGMIIIMAPIFICFLLFNITRSLFENWLRQLISYALQPIILFAGIALISLIIRTELYSSLGFRVCKHDFPNLGPLPELLGMISDDVESALSQSIFYWWFPSPMSSDDFSRKQAVIPVPYDHFQDNDNFCVAYGCFENRYIELPFLDPIKDIRRINNFFAGNFIQFDGLLLIFLCVYLLSKFNESSTKVSQLLSSTAGSYADAAAASAPAYDGINSAINKSYDRIDSAIDKSYSRLKEKLIQQVRGISRNNQSSIQRQATSNPKEEVLEEVKKNYGISPEMIDMKAQHKHVENLKATLLSVNPSMDINATANKLAQMNSVTELQDGLATVKFGKNQKYNNLATNDKEEIDKLINGNNKGANLKESLVNLNMLREYQQAYSDTQQNISTLKGGFSNVAQQLNKLKEFKNNITQGKQRLEDKKQPYSIHSGYEGLKGKMANYIGSETSKKPLMGAEWRKVQEKDSRLRTQDEILRDQDKSREYQNLQKQINQEVVKIGEDILSPEYLAKIATKDDKVTLEQYQNFAREKIKYQVYTALTQEKLDKNGIANPVLMGEKFMRDKASEPELKTMIDRAYEIQNDLIKNDRYLAREDYYMMMNDKAFNNIKTKYEILKEGIHLENISPNLLPEIWMKYNVVKETMNISNKISITELDKLYEKYSNDNNIAVQNKVSSMQGELTKMQESIANFASSEAILTQIDQRKNMIKQEILDHTMQINQYRANANMPAYEPKELVEQKKYTPRIVRVLDDLL